MAEPRPTVVQAAFFGVHTDRKMFLSYVQYVQWRILYLSSLGRGYRYSRLQVVASDSALCPRPRVAREFGRDVH